MKKTEYEILFIIKPQLPEADIKAIIAKFQDWITKNEGEILTLEEVGIRDLATEFDRQTQGFYVLSEFLATNTTLDALQEQLHITEDIFRNLIVRTDTIKEKKKVASSVTIGEEG